MNLIIPGNIKGLSSAEAGKILSRGSFNELPQDKGNYFWQTIKNVLFEPMFALLLACGLVYLLLGDIQEALVLLFFVLVVIFITIYQENKTAQALAALKTFSSPKALVLRDGEYVRIPSRELVPGDVIFLNEGDRVPADGIVLWNNNLSLNESLLTGESLPVLKKMTKAVADWPLDKNRLDAALYSGTSVLSGQGVALIKATGQQSEIGKIGRLMAEIKEEKTKIQRDFATLIKYISVIAVIFCLSVATANYLSSRHLLPSFLTGITLAMSLLPEELPVILAVFFSIGAWRMSREQVLIKKMSMVESLGAVTVLCVDKTGTLTHNKMKLSQIFEGAGDELETKEIVDLNLPTATPGKELIRISALACRQNTFDPLEKAIKEQKRLVFPKINIYEKLNLFHEYPLSHTCLAHTNVWERENDLLICAKGAPETIADLCSLSASQRKKIYQIVENMAAAGLRVLAVASQVRPDKDLPGELKNFKLEFKGLLGFADPIRTQVASSIRECYQAGIKVKMITGDYPATAQNIARQIGLANPDGYLQGTDFTNFNEVDLGAQIRKTNIFARMVPENKLQIIKSLKRDHEIVVMTGDGVNDGPALKAANIGVAMGEKGTDVAREAAGIVLLDDDFSSLVKGVKSGRRIFDNLRRAMVYTLATHIPIAGLALVPILLGWPLLLFPVHIMFLELIIDPVCSLVFEAEAASSDIMSRPPRDPRQAILSRRNLSIGLIQGLSVLVTILLVYKYSLNAGLNDLSVRTISFCALVFANIFLILINRSWTKNSFRTLFNKNRFLWPIIGVVLIFLSLIIYQPFLQGAFSFAPLSWENLSAAFIAALISVALFEILKIWQPKRLA